MLGMIISRVSFDFQDPGLKVKVTGYLQTNFVIALAPTFNDGF